MKSSCCVVGKSPKQKCERAIWQPNSSCFGRQLAGQEAWMVGWPGPDGSATSLAQCLAWQAWVRGGILYANCSKSPTDPSYVVSALEGHGSF